MSVVNRTIAYLPFLFFSSQKNDVVTTAALRDIIYDDNNLTIPYFAHFQREIEKEICCHFDFYKLFYVHNKSH